MRKKRHMDAVGVGPSTRNSSLNGSGIGQCNYGGSGLPSSGNHHNQGTKDDLYAELWHACAGPSVYVPRAGEKVFYFPQGHLEQVAAFTKQDGHMEIPAYDLPSKILCRVMCVQLKAEAYTDEVFAQVTLFPEPKQDELISEDKGICQIPPCGTSAYSFIKILTPSDTSTHGGFSVPKRHADECFRPLDMSQQPPTQELVAKDLHGFEWRFRHIYRGQPKRHLLTSGWSTFVNTKKLVAGDACIFLSGENGELRIGIRRAMKQHNNASTSTSLISGQSMQLGILASASHAVATGSMFTVYYRPWTNPSEFIIPLHHYMKSAEMDYSIGMRVQMMLDVEESTRRYAGTIIGIEDIDSIRWPGSEWRCLEVQWDAMLDTYMHIDRVCPWRIEPLESAKKKHIPILPLQKKARVCVPDQLLSGLSGFAKDDVVQNSVKDASQIKEMDLQIQDYNDVGSPQHAHKSPFLADLILPSKVTVRDSQFGMENQLSLQRRDPLHQSLGSSMSFPDEGLSTSSLSSQLPVVITYGVCNSVSITRDVSISNVNTDSESQGWPACESRDENEVPFDHPDGCNTYKLFGFSLIDSQPELPSPQVAAFSKISCLVAVPPISSQPSISAAVLPTKSSKSISGVTSEKKSKKCYSVNSRSCTKVLKRGTALGRAIDLTRFSGYDELISELDWMFDFRGSLINGSSGWHVTCTDDDGVTMLLGDYPWQDFQSMVQKMVICPKDGINNLHPSSSAHPTNP